MTDIKDIQAKVVDFAKKRSAKKQVELSAELSYIHLTEEMGEVARQLFNKKMRPDMFDDANLREEVVDVILEVLILAHACNVDLDKEIEKKLDSLFKKHGFIS